MLAFDSFAAKGYIFHEIHYRVRFRGRDKTLVEGVIEPRTFGGFRLSKEKRIPSDVERGMFDKRVQMDCRKCGSTIPAGIELCPYCGSPRDVLTMA